MNDCQAVLAARSGTDIVIETAQDVVTAASLQGLVADIGSTLTLRGARRVALLAENSPAWLATDLACQSCGTVFLPLPPFFSTAQLLHALRSAGIDTLLGSDAGRLSGIVAELPGQGRAVEWEVPTAGLFGWTLQGTATSIPAGTGKVTYTSGSTGLPKGVCLTTEQQWGVARALHAALGLVAPRHLCLLPLSTLLENVGGMYLPLLAGGRVVLATAGETGFSGGAGLDVAALVRLLDRTRPASLILLPEMLAGLVTALESGWRPPEELCFAAVGGARVAPGLINRARACGLPVYEGYGLSETASVACLNVPGRDRVGTVGRPLPHVTVNVRDGEVMVGGSSFLGYVDEPDSWYCDNVATGDLGTIDADGYVTVHGRRKNLLITGFGRNICPEWVESEVCQYPGIAQCVVFGDSRPYCIALLAALDNATGDAELQQAVDAANAGLPDYARIVAWHRLAAPLQAGDGLLTTSGKLRRAAIAARYARVIDSLYPDATPERNPRVAPSSKRTAMS